MGLLGDAADRNETSGTGGHDFKSDLPDGLAKAIRWLTADDLEYRIRWISGILTVVEVNCVEIGDEIILRARLARTIEGGDPGQMSLAGSRLPKSLGNGCVDRTINDPHRLSWRECLESLTEAPINDDDHSVWGIDLHAMSSRR